MEEGRKGPAKAAGNGCSESIELILIFVRTCWSKKQRDHMFLALHGYHTANTGEFHSTMHIYMSRHTVARAHGTAKTAFLGTASPRSPQRTSGLHRQRQPNVVVDASHTRTTVPQAHGRTTSTQHQLWLSPAPLQARCISPPSPPSRHMRLAARPLPFTRVQHFSCPMASRNKTAR